MIFINIFDMKTESTKTQEKKLETLEEAAVAVLFESNGNMQAIDILKNMYQLAVKLEQIEVDDANMAEVKDEIDDLPKRIAFIAKKLAASHGISVDPTQRLFGMDGTYDNKHTYKAWQDDNGQLHRGRPAI